MSRLLSGGCQCGRVRFEAEVEEGTAYLCHCTMCRRATGGVAAAFVGVRKAAVRWTGTPPDLYRSSPIAERGFCARCGTPISFAFPDSETMDLTVGAFDDPGGFRPAFHMSVETRLDPWVDTADLPGYRLDEHASVVERWKRATGGFPG